MWANPAGTRPVAAHLRTDGETPVNVKKVVTLAAVALLLFLLITQPDQSAEAVKTALGWLRQGAESIITFIRSLFN
ncbi:hypothetical protein SUDANB95_00925 [Actinosynnema sp. ALI-1.44]